MYVGVLPLKNCIRLFNVFALVFGGIVSANASPILVLGSYGTTASNPGVGNTAVTYDSADSIVNNGSTSTFDISPGTIWHAPTGTSSWVSYNATTGPTSNFATPNGDYIYKSTFTISPGDVNSVGTLTVLADDTLSVFLNNSLILEAAGPLSASNPYSLCSNVGANCVTPLTFNFTGLQAGLNQLEFDVKQVAGVDEGLDFSGSIDPSDPSAVPEPFSLALLGTGMLSLVGVCRRYVQAS
jgi:hypothetical protein